METGKIVKDNLALVISVIIGLNMLWAELVRARTAKIARQNPDKTAIDTKNIDDNMSFRKDLIDEIKNLRMELREKSKQLNESHTALMTRFQVQFEEEVDCSERIAGLLKQVEDLTALVVKLTAQLAQAILDIAKLPRRH